MSPPPALHGLLPLALCLVAVFAPSCTPTTPNTPATPGGSGACRPADGCPAGSICQSENLGDRDAPYSCRLLCARDEDCPAGEVCRLATIAFGKERPRHCGKGPRLACMVRNGVMVSCEESDDACCFPENFLTEDPCKNTRTDPVHCGGCTVYPGQPISVRSPHHCAEGASCVGGLCGCPANQQSCGGAAELECVDVQTNPMHCGGCDAGCSPSTLCDAGACTCRPEARCDGGCASIADDAQNCGGCGLVCPTGLCTNGQCQPDVLFTADSRPLAVELVGDQVFWIEEVGQALRRRHLDGGDDALLATQQRFTGSLSADERQICWGTQVVPLTGVQCRELDGGSTRVVLAGVTAVQLDLFGDQLLFLGIDGVPGIRPLDGGAVRTLPFTDAGAVAWAGGLPLLSLGGTAFVAQEDGGRTEVFSHPSEVTALAPHGNDLYFLSSGTSLRRFLPDGGSLTVLDGLHAGAHLEATDEALFFVDQERGRILRLPYRP